MSREATVLRARLIRASNANEPHTRREVLGVPEPSDPSGGGFRQHRWTTTQMSRQVASAVIGEASLTEVEVRWGFASEGGLPRSATGAFDLGTDACVRGPSNTVAAWRLATWSAGAG